MSTSTSTRTFTSREGNVVKTVVEKTVTHPDGRTVTTREEKTETASGAGGASIRARGANSGDSDMIKQFDDMRMSKTSDNQPSSGAPQPKPATSEVSLKDFRDQSLKAHNDRRKKHGVDPLKMSSDLNDYAQNWAEYLANSGTFQHSKCTLNNDRLGENIANKMSSAGADYTGEDAVQQWYSEISKHSYSSEQSMGTGHFTQVVWKGSKELGMGKAKSSDGKKVFVVGSYRPAGNMIGSFTQNVFPPK